MYGAVAKPDGLGLPAFVRDTLERSAHAGAVCARAFEGGNGIFPECDQRRADHSQRGGEGGSDLPCPALQDQVHHTGGNRTSDQPDQPHTGFGGEDHQQPCAHACHHPFAVFFL